MVVGQDDLTRQQEPTALFELGVNGSGNPEGPDNHKVSEKTALFFFSFFFSLFSQNEDRFCVEFNHKELFDFFLQLERMQHQLDGLSKN
jgi:hypothetical protein